MAWLRRAVTVDVTEPPIEVARRLMDGIRRDGAPRLFGHAGAFGFAFHTEWRPALLRQHYPVTASGTFTPAAAGTRVEATVSVGFAVLFMLGGVVLVAAFAVWAGLRGLWSPLTAALVLGVALGHVYSVIANLRDAERSLRRALETGPA
ncbi:MAG: hypothetical protein AB7H93_22325 [Vicinamibacterales bacterium]